MGRDAERSERETRGNGGIVMMYRLCEKHEKDLRPCCDGYADALLEMMKENDKVIHIDCDLMGCIDVGKVKAVFPDRVLNAGIAEANAVGVAAGMAATGMIPFVHSFGVFASRRAFDQAYLSAGYSRWPVHVIGSDPGVTAAFNGATHMPFEDAGLYLDIPNATVIDPCDYNEAFSLSRKLLNEKYVTYMRLIRRDHIQVYEDGSEFEIGKGILLKEGADVTIVASGILVYNALVAAEKLEAMGISASLIDMHTWKPLDEDLLLKDVAKTGAVVTAENHQVSCGLGSTVANVLIRKLPVPQEFIGNQGFFGQCGPQADLEREYHMTADDIAAAALRAIDRKG